MKKYLVVAAVLALGLLMCTVPGVSLAQEKEEIEYCWGTVSSVSSNQIVVTEYDYDRDEDVNATYTVDPKVELRNVGALKDIKVGDSINIDYVVRGDKKVAKIIAVEKPSYEEDTEHYPDKTETETFEFDFE